ncbi:MAG: SCO family protein [Gammaproteobacteria bacterium]
MSVAHGWKLLAGALLLLAWSPVPADEKQRPDEPFDDAFAFKTSQAALGRVLGNYRLVDTEGRSLSLQDFRGKPLLISLVYTSCYHTCPFITRQLAKAAKIARAALGDDSFALLTIGFDAPNDTPDRMAAYAGEQGITLPGWRFASVDAATSAALARDLGFVYRASSRGFDHLIQTTVVDGDGRIFQQIYGQDFAPPAVVEPLKQLLYGTRANAVSISGWVNGLKLFCTVYDANSGRYVFDYSVFVALFAGIASTVAIAAFIVHAWRGSRLA